MKKYIQAWWHKERYFLMAVPGISWQLFFFMMPILFVIALAFFSYTSGSLFQGFTVQNIIDVCNWSHIKIALRSVLLASVTAWMCLLLAYPLAYFIAFRATTYKFFLLFLLAVPFLINLLVQVYAWFFILDKHGIFNYVLGLLGFIGQPVNILNTRFAIYLVMIHVYLPFMVLPLFSSLEKLNVKLLEASRDLGASFWKTIRNVVFPLSISGIKAGFFLVYVTAFGEYVIPSLMGGNKVFFMGTLIAEYFFIGKDWGHGAAFTFICLLILATSAFLYNWLITKMFVGSRREKSHGLV